MINEYFNFREGLASVELPYAPHQIDHAADPSNLMRWFWSVFIFLCISVVTSGCKLFYIFVSDCQYSDERLRDA